MDSSQDFQAKFVLPKSRDTNQLFDNIYTLKLDVIRDPIFNVVKLGLQIEDRRVQWTVS